ncbi:Hypothetical protein HVR_LOCUS1035 [uncultured virus]|nr:Hypothetical protein HVR_LOCUS1035 [uncultured virus]
MCTLQPPNISGRWKGENVYLRQETPDQNITLKDIKTFDYNSKIKQKGLFVTWKEESNIVRNESGLRLGVWRPIYKYERIDNCDQRSRLDSGCKRDKVPSTGACVYAWELLLSDSDDSNIGFVQVAKKDDNGNPIKLHVSFVESGFQKGNPEQKPTVGDMYLKKVDNECSSSRCYHN